MITAFELAGFFAAHAIWCVSTGETLTPMLAFTTADGKRQMHRLIVNDDLVESVDYGKEQLESNEMDADDAVLLYDGRIPIGNEKVDAIIIEIRAYFLPAARAMLAVPYRTKSSGGFAVHRPKLLVWEGCEDCEPEAAFQAFFESVADHETGAEIWNRCLDESK